MLRLDYISCLLTIVSTILIGRRVWQGWIVAGLNSVIICVIGIRTAQTGFIPANLFCLAIYAYNLVQWRSATDSPNSNASDTLTHTRRSRNQRAHAAHDDGTVRHLDRVLPRRLRSSAESRTRLRP